MLTDAFYIFLNYRIEQKVCRAGSKTKCWKQIMQNNSYRNYLLKLFASIFCVGLLAASFAADSFAQNRRGSTTPKISDEVCPDPRKPCHHREKKFDVWELSFHLPAKIKPNTTYKSAAFYAVIIKKYDAACEEFDFNSTIEPERLRVQKLYPTRKVFADYSCPNMDAVGYDFTGRTDKSGDTILYMDYIAVYAGKSSTEADKLLEELRVKFPKAEVKKMTANWERLEQ
jgi:hypothetical protein